ncbi:DUF6332 family protein [Streptomyces sp. NPDC051219]
MERAVVPTGGAAVTLVFILRVAHALWGFTSRPAADQPSQPGRTKPDS